MLRGNQQSTQNMKTNLRVWLSQKYEDGTRGCERKLWLLFFSTPVSSNTQRSSVVIYSNFNPVGTDQTAKHGKDVDWLSNDAGQVCHPSVQPDQVHLSSSFWLILQRLRSRISLCRTSKSDKLERRRSETQTGCVPPGGLMNRCEILTFNYCCVVLWSYFAVKVDLYHEGNLFDVCWCILMILHHVLSPNFDRKVY